MALKDIITLVDLNGPRHAIKVALELAQTTDAHVTGLALAFDPVIPGFISAPMPSNYLDVAREQAMEAASSALETFKESAKRAGVHWEARTANIVSGGAADPFIAQARISDLIIMGQDDGKVSEPMREMLIEAAMFESGVPVMLVPYIGTPSFSTDHVMIAWDGSRTAMRAVHAALPVLKLAKKVSVVIVDKGQARAGEPGADLATYLSRHGLQVTIETISRPQTKVADALLNFISDNAVNLVVMGGYGHSRMREFVLGGVTRSMLTSMTVPVLMAH
ncbi:universal stress protein [Breoghania sp. L-A4]|uniref:universal stress protein n=1 Tax=Breoghania sp. L-A4 TaxID=2304600 RepID=UPI000E35B627|nr:universal stress protein [Breoghania sp. L-A4]AXS39374.1 universal stress protein [Breoghania sp. L-A4]